MPTIIDATVVNQPYDTSGNGGRKLVKLDNGWLVLGVQTNTSLRIAFYVSKDNGVSWTFLCNLGSNSMGDFSLVSRGTVIHVASRFVSTNHLIFHHMFDATTVVVGSNIYDNSSHQIEGNTQTEIGNVSLTINLQGTELHATWASKNSSYPNSFNIRYAKGTINADGSVTWGAVEQVTKQNSTTTNITNPVITLDKNGSPYIITQSMFSSSDYRIQGYYGSNFAGVAQIFWGASYTQSSPSAIFVPSEINGLPNGRIWVAWRGMNAINTTFNSLYVSYSDDGGLTWATATMLRQGNTTDFSSSPSITANNKNEVTIVYERGQYKSGTVYNIAKITNINNVWGDIINLTATNTGYTPSALFDLSTDFTSPLFIYKDSAKVGFYGTWTTTEISVPQGDLGVVTDKDNLLNYSITTDEEMSTITEKVNGVVVGTKTATSGQELSVGLTDEMWDEVSYGKYADTLGTANTLTIEMGSNKWIYTFDKRLSTVSDVLSVAKAVKDSSEVQLPAIKQMLVDKVGGNVADSFEDIIVNFELGVIGGKKWASGTVSTTISSYAVAVSGLLFKPNFILLKSVTGAEQRAETGLYINKDSLGLSTEGNFILTSNTSGNNGAFVINSNGFNVTLNLYNKTYQWIAFE